MNDRDQTELIPQSEEELPSNDSVDVPTPMQDMEVFGSLLDVVRSHYLWKWDASAKFTKQVVKDLTTQVNHDPQFRLVGDIEVDEDIFEITLWLEDSVAISLASLDVMMLESLQIDFSRCAIMARELTQNGLEYHLVTFGDGRAQQFHINIIGPRLQQIRDLGTLVASTIDTFSA